MAFPSTPRDIRVELYLNGTWVDVTSDVYSRDSIEITRGRADEQATTSPSTCALTLDNRAGNYSQRNPLGAYYGQLSRNTPMRVSLGLAADSFSRTVSGGWGTADSGGGYVVGWTGTGSAASFAVTGGVGTQSIAAVNEIRLGLLTDIDQADVDVTATFTLPSTNVTGGPIGAALIVRGQGLSDYYMAFVGISTSEQVDVSFYHADLTYYGTSGTIPGLTYTGPMKIRVQAEGRAMRAKVWLAGTGEPFDWNVEARVDVDPSPGWVGMRSDVLIGNTNALPVVVSWDDLEARLPRFAGEVSQWPARTDITGVDAFVPIEAAGILRRLNQGDAPISSALRRYIPTLNPVEYWPLEDGDTTRTGQSTTGGTPAYFHQELQLDPPVGGIEWAVDTQLPGGLQAPNIHNGGFLVFPFRPQLLTQGGVWSLTWAMRYSASAGATFIIWTNSTATNGLRWRFVFWTDGSITVDKVTTPSTPAALSFPPQRPEVYDDVWRHYTFIVDQRTSTLGVYLWIDQRLYDTYTEASGPVGYPTFAEFWTSNVDDGGVTLAHVALIDGVGFSAIELGSAAQGFTGETAGNRMARLCNEEGVPFALHGTAADTALCGPQRVGGFVDLLQEAADADLGTLYESRGHVGLAYRTLTSQDNQPPVAAITYSNHELEHPFEPVDDDQRVRNDVTAKRPDGGDAQVTLDTGRLSTLTPAEGGVGRYNTSVTANVAADDQLPDVAGWRLHQGTIDEARFPRVRLNLANPEVVANATLSRALLDVDVDSRVTVDGAAAIGLYDDIRQVARGYTETLAQYEHRLVLNCTPASAHDVVELDDGVSKVDTSGSTVTSDITSSATSMSVTSPNELWTTAAGDMPISITVGGEVMTVTAVSGASSPQTFTVTRAVNGVSKAQVAGTDVRLTRRATITP